MDIRTKLIASGQIRPAGTTQERGVRQTLIYRGHVIPAPKGETMPQIMRHFMTKVCGR